jgi:hypothetical protein
MHIDTIPNRNSRPAYLLRESVRLTPCCVLPFAFR